MKQNPVSLNSLLLIFLVINGFFFHSCNSQNDYSYNEIEVEYFNLKDGVKLAGTLTLPVTEKKVPAVLLIQGSGPYDRNEEILGHSLFEVIATHLSEKGIAVLRADKRGVGKSGGQYIPFDIESFVGDAFAGVHFLENQNQIDSKKIGLIGHSLGGLIAPIMASTSENISFIVLMAGPAEWGREIFYTQNKLLAKNSGVPEEEYQTIKELSYRMYEILTKENVLPEDEDEFREIYNKLSGYLDQELRSVFYPGPPENALYGLRTPQFKKAFSYNPSDILSHVKCPVLAMNGSLDLHIPSTESLLSIENALKKGGNKNFKILELKNHNHAFQRCKTGRFSEMERIRESVSPIALKSISDWILLLIQE